MVEYIRGHQLKELVHDHTAAVVTSDIAQIYATVDIRYVEYASHGNVVLTFHRNKTFNAQASLTRRTATIRSTRPMFRCFINKVLVLA